MTAPNIRLAPAFDEAEASAYQKRSWWIRNDGLEDGARGRWIDLGDRPDGTQPIAVYLPPGRYTIGAGPPEACRREVRIRPDGCELVTRAPCVTPGCAGLVAYRPSSPPPRCEPFDLSPPAARLCLECRP
jgi:hypothetical protein